MTPEFDEAGFVTPEVESLLADHGVRGVTDIVETGSEVDRTLLITSPAGRSVLKQSPVGSTSSRMQAGLLAWVEAEAPHLPLPRVLRSSTGEIVTATETGDVFVMTASQGTPLEDATLTPAVIDDLADVQIALLRALATADATALEVPDSNDWSIDAVASVDAQIVAFADDRHRDLLLTTAADYRQAIAPAIARLPRQVLHADFNLSNVFVSSAGTTSDRVTGVIDFGDAVRAPRVFDVAVTACYLALALGDLDHPLVGRYLLRMGARLELEVGEIALIRPLVLCRLVLVVVLARETAHREPDRADYVLRYDRLATALLDTLDSTPLTPLHQEA